MPKIPHVIAGPTQLGGPARPEDAGSGLGTEALAQASKETARVTEALFNEEGESQVSGAVGRANRELNTLQHEIASMPDHNERTAVYAKKSQEIIRRYRGGLTFPKFQGRFGERIEPTLERGRMSIAQGVRQSQIDTARGDRLLNIESLQDSLANATDQGHRKQIAEDIKAEIAAGLKGGLWSAETAARMTIQSENRMEVETLLVQSQVEADEIMAGEPDPEKRLKRARKDYSGALRDQVVARIEHRNYAEATNRQKLHDAMKSTLILQAYSKGEDHLTEEKFFEIAEREKLPADVITAVRAAIVHGENRTDIKDGYRLYFETVEYAADPLTRPKFLRMDLWAEFGGRMDPKLIEKLLANKAKGAMEPLGDFENRVDRKMGSLDMPVTDAQYKADQDGSKKSELFRAAALAAKTQMESRLKRPLESDEQQALVDRLGDEIVTDVDPLWDDTLPLYRVTPATEIVDVPKEWSNQIRANLIDDGKLDPEYASYSWREPDPVTDLVRETYLDLLLQKREGSEIGVFK